MISDIATFDTKAIKFDSVVKTTTALIEKKTPKKTAEMWNDIITESENAKTSPATEIEALHFEDRRLFFRTYTDKLSTIKDLRDVVKKDKMDGNDTTDWQPDQAKLNQLILNTDMELEQMDDSLLGNKKYIAFFEQNIKNKDFFKTGLAYQEVVKQSYQTFFLQLYADLDLNQGKVSDGAFKMAHDFQSDIAVYTKFAARYAKYGDKKCDPLPIWPEVVLTYCDENAERDGFGDNELAYCTCWD
jgi:hypothetical protein